MFFKKHTSVLWVFCFPFFLLSAEVNHKKTLEVYISTNGKDSHNGLSVKTPIYSMKKAEHIVKKALSKKHRNAIIHIDSGLYKRQHTIWNFTMEDRNITFRGNQDTKPIFDGEGINATWLRINHHPNHTKTNIHIQNIHVQNYARAIMFYGNKKDKTKKVNYNIVKNCTFKNIGDKYSNAKIGYAAISVINSSFNLFENNEFINIENNKTIYKSIKKKSYNTENLIHAFYFAYYSSSNYVKNNLFQNISGDAIKVRDFCNNNIIEDNLFYNVKSVFQDWYAHYTNKKDVNHIECFSWNNVIINNRVGTLYQKKNSAPLTDIKIYFPKGSNQKKTCNTLNVLKYRNSSKRLYKYNNINILYEGIK